MCRRQRVARRDGPSLVSRRLGPPRSLQTLCGTGDCPDRERVGTALACGARAMQHPSCTVLFATVVIATLAGCRAGPSKAEALDAIRATSPGLETTTAFARVWQDGPPWFSCAEVLSKIGSRADARVVYDQVGNWRPLVVSGWLVLRDTTHGVVSDPGWCTGKLANEGA